MRLQATVFATSSGSDFRMCRSMWKYDALQMEATCWSNDRLLSRTTPRLLTTADDLIVTSETVRDSRSSTRCCPRPEGELYDVSLLWVEWQPVVWQPLVYGTSTVLNTAHLSQHIILRYRDVYLSIVRILMMMQVKRTNDICQRRNV